MNSQLAKDRKNTVTEVEDGETLTKKALDRYEPTQDIQKRTDRSTVTAMANIVATEEVDNEILVDNNVPHQKSTRATKVGVIPLVGSSPPFSPPEVYPMYNQSTLTLDSFGSNF
jgi:hypothetical protein